MKIVLKTEQEFEIKDSLNLREVDILKNPDNCPEIEYQSFYKKLIFFKEKNYWILCDCQPSAILVLCMSPKANLFVRCKQRKNHHVSCFFYQKTIELKTNNLPLLLKKDKLNLNLYKTSICNLKETGKPFSGNQQSKRVSISKLGSLVYMLLNNAKLNKLSNKFPTKTDQYANLGKSAKEIKISKSYTLDRMFFRWLSQNTLNIGQDRLLQLQAKWQKNSYPFLLYLTPGYLVDTHTISSTCGYNQILHIENSIKLPSGRISLESSPYLIFFTAILKNNNLTFPDAFAMPIFSNTLLIPVESNFERQVLQKILAHTSITNNISSVTVSKPLFLMGEKSGQQYRPDFIVEYSKKKIFVEVLGSNEYSYIEQKEKIARNTVLLCDKYISVDCANGREKYYHDLKYLTDAITNFFPK